MMDASIPAITVYSDNFERLYQRWARSLPSGFHPVVKKIEVTNDGFGFNKNSWFDAIAQKIQFFIDTLKGLPDGQICLCCDVDIIFLRKIGVLSKYARTRLTNDGLDFFFMRECGSSDVNGGFYFVKNSERVRDILSVAKTYCTPENVFADQCYFNGAFKKLTDIKWDYIPTDMVAWGDRVFCPSKALFHHAVCCKNIEDKIKQQNRIIHGLKLLKILK